jgi:hypothetical protein
LAINRFYDTWKLINQYEEVLKTITLKKSFDRGRGKIVTESPTALRSSYPAHQCPCLVCSTHRPARPSLPSLCSPLHPEGSPPPPCAQNPPGISAYSHTETLSIVHMIPCTQKLQHYALSTGAAPEPQKCGTAK